MSDAGVLQSSAPARRAGDGAPTLRLVVDALIDGRPVKWDAVARRGSTPFEQRMAQQVRALSRLSSDAGVCAGGAASRVARPCVLECTLAALALSQVAVALAAGAWLDAGAAAQPVRFAWLAATVAVALGLMRHGRRVPPARLLGQGLLLVAAWQSRPFLEALVAAGAPLWVRAWWQAVFVEAFLPVAAWRLAQECPPSARLSPFDRASTTVLGAALVCGVGLAAVSAWWALTEPPPNPVYSRMIPTVALAWGLVSLITIAVRSWAARADHQARVVVAFGPLGQQATTSSSAPSRVASTDSAVPGARFPVPGSAIHPWLLPAKRTTRASARWRTAVAERVGSMLAVFRGTHATALASLGADLQHARSLREVTSALMTHVNEALHPSALAVVAPAPGAWTVLGGRVPPLAAGSAIACMLASADEATRVDATASVHALLPAVDREWLDSARVATLVRLASRDGDTLAGLLVGAHADGRRHSRRERAFITAASRTAAMALASLERPSAVHSRDDEADDLAFECEVCGHVSDVPDTCECGSDRQLAALPAWLHGTFRVERRIGRGGMGVVYLGSDVRLGRPVALKTLPSLSSASVAALRCEARAMAAVTHQSVAVLYGLDEWRGTPVLVTEYLAGGTLATRLSGGPLAIAEALTLGASVADALAVLHGRGWLHRDIKPSNIGFCSDGTPKLLDFGLTRWRPASTDASEPLAGTPLYLSPELLDGEPASEHDDVWALALVVVEMITGTHPFEADHLDDALRHVRCRAPMQWTPMMPPGIAQVLSSALHPTPARRLATAREFAAALRAVHVTA